MEHLVFVTASMVLAAIALALCIFLLLTRLYPHDATRPQFGAAMVGILVAVLFGVILNNWYAARRDRDNRLRALRDQHYGQLKPVLRMESSKLAELAEQIRKQAHISGVTHYQNIQTDPSTVLWPDVISKDLQHHFPAYDRSKRELLSLVQAQDNEFREAVALAEKQIDPRTGIDPYWKEIAAMSYLEMCTGRGEGVKLRITDNGFSFEYWGASVGASGGGATPPRAISRSGRGLSGLRIAETERRPQITL